MKNHQCKWCKHKHRGSYGCDAFPEGIPEEIILHGKSHLKPLPGQKNKIVFKPVKGTPKTFISDYWIY